MDVFAHQLKGLSILGLGREKPRKEFLLIHRVLLWSFLFYFLAMYAIFIAENYTDLMASALTVTCLSVDIISVTKIIVFWHNLDRLYALMDKIEHNVTQSKFTTNANRFGQNFSKIFLYQLAASVVIYNLTPISLNIIKYLLYGSEWTPDMPLKFKSFVDIKYSPAYEITYLAIVLDICFIGVVCFVVDTLFLICCVNIGGEFEDLRVKVHEWDKRQFIICHEQTLALAKELKDIFRPIIFVEFLIISVVLCGIGFTFVMARDIVELALLTLFGSVMLIQLFIYCYSGQYLTDRAISVCDELYPMDRDYKLMIMRSQRRVRIEAPFFKASMEQFTSVLNTTWALISVLRSSIR